MVLPSNFLGDLIAATQGGTMEPTSNAFGQALNAGAMLPDLGPVQTRAMTQGDMPAPPRMAEAGRPRRSILDMIGGVADTLATVGGAAPLYQPNLDAQRARQLAIEDRQYEVDQRPLERKFAEQKLARGDQEIEGGTIDLQNARNELLNSAGAGMRQVFGRSGTEGVQKAWPLLAKQLGIPDDKAAEIGQSLATDPEGTLAALFPDPTLAKGGSKAKEIQIYEMLKANGDEETAQAYMESLANPNKPLTEYQKAQIAAKDRDYNRRVYEFDNPKPSAAAQTAGTKAAAADEARAAGAKQVGATLDRLSGLYDKLDEMGAVVNPERGVVDNIQARLGTSAVGQLLGGATGRKAQTLIDQVQAIRPALMQQLSKALGMTSKQLDSNTDVKLFMQTVTDPTASYQANKAAIEGLRSLLASAPAPRAAPASAPGRPAPRRKDVPAPKRSDAIQLKSAADYAKVPSGALFITPDGKLMRKK